MNESAQLLTPQQEGMIIEEIKIKESNDLARHSLTSRYHYSRVISRHSRDIQFWNFREYVAPPCSSMQECASLAKAINAIS